MLISGNQITAAEYVISLNGATNVRITGNLLKAPLPLLQRRMERLVSDTAEPDSENDRFLLASPRTHTFPEQAVA